MGQRIPPTFLVTLPASQPASRLPRYGKTLCHGPNGGPTSSLRPLAPRPSPLAPAGCTHPIACSWICPTLPSAHPRCCVPRLVYTTCTYSTYTGWLALDLTVLYGYSLCYLTAQMMSETDLGGVERGGSTYVVYVGTLRHGRYPLSYFC